MYQRQVSFTEAVTRALKQNYCNFEGRASRSEFWWFYLFSLLLGWAIGLIFMFSDTLELIVSGVVSLALLLPSLGLGVRRLHDTNHSGWWLLLWFVPVIGWIVLLIWLIQDSEHHPNQYGPEPNVI